MKINAEMVRAYMPDRTYVETSGNAIKINDRKTGGAIFVSPDNNIVFEADDVREDIRVMLRVLCKASH